MTEKHTAVAKRVQDGWDVQVPDVPEATTHVERLEQVAPAAAEAIAGALQVDAAEIEVDVRSTVDEDVDATVDLVTRERRAHDEAARTVVTAQQRLAHRLVGMGLSHHDSAYLMNLSHHRVRQLVETAPDRVAPTESQAGAGESGGGSAAAPGDGEPTSGDVEPTSGGT